MEAIFKNGIMISKSEGLTASEAIERIQCLQIYQSVTIYYKKLYEGERKVYTGKMQDVLQFIADNHQPKKNKEGRQTHYLYNLEVYPFYN